MTKRILSVVVAMIIVLSSVTIVSAATYSGTCGEKLTWSLDTDTGLLRISGTGAMAGFDFVNDAPWLTHSDSIRNIHISEGVASIGYEAFRDCKNLMGVTIPNSVKSIDLSAFENCKNLTGIEIPSSVISIEGQAFWGCDSLISINVDSSNSNYKSVDGVLYNKSGKNLVRYPGGKKGAFKIPNGVTSIEEQAFRFCAGLTSIEIPNSITSIGKYTFANNSNLTSVTISDSVTSIGAGAFDWCTSLTSIEIPGSVKSIGDGAFYACFNLTSATIHDGVSSIGAQAFGCCRGLMDVSIPNSVTSIEFGAFHQCASLTSIEIPNSVTFIGESAFSNCDSLTSINVDGGNSNYKSVDGVLYDKSGKTLVGYLGGKTEAFTIPDGVTFIGAYAFYACTSLTGVTIPDSVTSIEEGAFVSCYSLTNIEIPGSVTSIGKDAFSDCPNLTIDCNEGGAAHKYAVNNNIPFRLDGGGVVTPELKPCTSEPEPTEVIIDDGGSAATIDNGSDTEIHITPEPISPADDNIAPPDIPIITPDTDIISEIPLAVIIGTDLAGSIAGIPRFGAFYLLSQRIK